MLDFEGWIGTNILEKSVSKGVQERMDEWRKFPELEREREWIQEKLPKECKLGDHPAGQQQANITL